MKTKRLKILGILTIMLVLILTSTIFFACNKNKVDNTDYKQIELDKLVDLVLQSEDSNWTSNLEASSLNSMTNAGDYIVADEWIKFFADTIHNSSIQTAKIKNISAALITDEGKKFMNGEAVDISDLFSIFKDMSLTSIDITNLFYDLINGFLNNGKIVFDNSINRINEVKGVDQSTRENLAHNLNLTTKAKDSFEVFNDSKQEILSALDSASVGINALIDGGYEIVNSLNENLIDSISSGALHEISESEMKTYLDSILNTIKDIDNVLTEDQLLKMENALSLLNEKFDGVILLSNILSTIVEYSNYAYLAIDFIPVMLDIIIAGGSSLDISFIQKLQQFYEVETYDDVNKSIFLAEFLYGGLQSFAGDNLDGQELVQIIDEIILGAENDLQKQMALCYMSMLLVFDFAGNQETEFSNDIIDIIKLDLLKSKFKKEYMNYQLTGNIQVGSTYSQIATLIGHASAEKYSEKWFNEVVEKIDLELQEKYNAISGVIEDNLKNIITDFYLNDLSELKELADMGLMNDTDVGCIRLFELTVKFQFNLILGIK